MNNLVDSPELMMRRKDEHIQICSDMEVEGASTDLFSVTLKPTAFPEMDFAEVDSQSDFLGHKFAVPVLITGMTGGVHSGFQINEVLAVAAEQCGIPMGLGSQKLMLSEPKTAPLFQIRKKAPKLFLIGNIGAVSGNYGVSPDDIQRLVETCELNAFALHINALQECIQPEGERNFSHLFRFIESVVKSVKVPIIVKEVGAGIDMQSIARLVDIGVAAIDVGGMGGTSWSFIEGQRGDEMTARLGSLFRSWGIPTHRSLFQAQEVIKEKKSNTQLIATGGVRDGIRIAKLIGLGATITGVGLPLFRAAVEGLKKKESFEKGVEGVVSEVEFLKRSLKIAMFCSGSKNLSDLKSKIEFQKGPL